MRVFSLLILPGTSSRPRDNEDEEECPNCGRPFSKYRIRRSGKVIQYCCPYCGYVIEEERG